MDHVINVNTNYDVNIKFYKKTNHFAEMVQLLFANNMDKSTNTNYIDKEFTKDLIRIQRGLKKLKI